MATNFHRESTMTVGKIDYVDGVWVRKGLDIVQRPGPLRTQLLFNEAKPSCALNRVTQMGSPAPIVIEKLVTRTEMEEEVEEDNCNSLRLSVLSVERMESAVRLAKRDLRRRRQESLCNLSLKPGENSPVGNNADSQLVWSPNKDPKAGTQVLVYTPQKLAMPPGLEHGQTPPTRDPGQGAGGPKQQLSREIHRLQKELSNYIQKIEQLASKGQRVADTLEPEEKRRMDIRRQEQAARSARMIYGLQQQVNEIQEDLDKLRSQNIQHTKKSRAMGRLAAAHRGAVRAMQVFIGQLSDPSEGGVPAHSKQLGQLIRQLSLCSAKVEGGSGSGSDAPKTTLDILQKLETLDSALSKQESPGQGEPSLRDVSPGRPSGSRPKGPKRPPQPAPRSHAARGRKSATSQKKTPGRRLGVPPQRMTGADGQRRRQVLRAGLESLVRLREAEEQRRPAPRSPSKRSGAVPAQQTGVSPVRDAGFQKPTVSSRLRETQPVQLESSVPWLPASPHSSQRQRERIDRPEPRCLFSPGKGCTEPSGQQSEGPDGAPDGAAGAQASGEALRQAWLERVTAERLRELNRLSKEETEHINRLRSEVLSPTQWAERAERAVRERLQPLLNPSQAIEAVLDKRSEEAAQTVLLSERERRWEETLALPQRPTLESMLQRMEEIEKDQEDVRRRFAQISYSDLLPREKDSGAKMASACGGPASPQPIRLTRPVLQSGSTAHILLESPLDVDALSESSAAEEAPTSPPVSGHVPSSRMKPGGRAQLRVPVSMQRSIQQYRENVDSYLQLVSHQTVGTFNPWVIADSLADDLLSEALADVAAEFHDICEECAEAVFTSEFLQPVPSPSASVA